MAKAKAICKCEICGNEFEMTAIKNNRRDADSWEGWAKDHYTVCSNCYHEKKQEELKNKAESVKSKFALPQLNGVSEKQTSYAETLRDKYITSYSDRIELAAKANASINKEKLKVQAEVLKMTETELLATAFKERGLYSAYACLYENNAGKLIDIIKNNQ